MKRIALPVIGLIAVLAFVLAATALAAAAGDSKVDSRYDQFVSHCDQALERSRTNHQHLIDEYNELREADEKSDANEYADAVLAKADQVDEDAVRDVCGVKVGEAHKNPDKSFADFVGGDAS